jgi:hypothetical protein
MIPPVSRRRPRLALLLALATLALVLGCGPTWEGAQLRDAQTRRGEAIVDLSTTLRVSATRITPELAEVLAERRCDARQCGDQRRALVAAARERAQRETRFALAVYTAKQKWNDLDDRDSQWTLSLSADGARVEPSLIRAVRDQDSQARLFPDLDGFDKAYEVSFPVSVAQARELSFIISGLHGELRLDWRAR